ncbi:MAG: hypothetical protein K2I78_03035, partial [Clostridia bacterium]|nr:hypothetical protein [Clostridia bacterium]
MDIRKRKIKGIFVLTALLILCLCGASVLSFFTPKKTVNAIKIENIASQSTNLGEMLLDGYENDPTGIGKIFDGDIFWELVSQISGVSNPNESTLDNLTMPKTSADFRTNNNELGNGTKDIVVQIGKKKWIATYLSTNNSGEPILTLWLANSATTVRWNEKVTDAMGKYPSNMYGTSEMRAVTLNNGGGYAVNYNDTSLKPVSQSASSEWAMYTMDKAQKVESIKEFIEVPDNMSWQHNQVAKGNVTSSAYTGSYNYNNNNDALDIGGSYSSTYNYLTNTTVDTDGYKGWANDTLWLPSVAETGVSGVEGIWKTTDSSRANGVDSWLRSAGYQPTYNSYKLLDSGSKINSDYVNHSTHAVRPAFHLNLAKV